MALNEVHAAYKFAGGIETKMDPKAVPAIRLLALENGVFGRAISIKKRNGYEAKSRVIDGSTTLISDTRRLAARDKELLQFTAARCYSKHTSADVWSDAGAVVCPIGTERPVVATSTQQTMPDRATSGGVTAYAWEDSRGGVYWTVEDETSGRVYRAPAQAHASGQRPRCLAVGDGIHIYYAVPTLREIQVIIVNPAAPSAAVTPATLVSDLSSTNPVYDAAPTERTGSPAVIAWQEYATTSVRVGYVTGGGALGSPANGHPSVVTLAAALEASSPLGVAYLNDDGLDADYIALVYVRSSAGLDGVMRFLTGGDVDNAIGDSVDTTAVGYAAPVDVQRATIVFGGATAHAVWEEAAAQSSQRYCVVNTCHTSGSSLGTERTIRSVGLASKAFTAGPLDTSVATTNADTFAVFVHDTTYFNTYVTLRLSDFAPAGRHWPAAASGAPSRTHLPSVHVTDDIATVVLPYRTRLSSTNNDKFTETALGLVTMDFDSEDSHQTAQLGAGLYMAGACPQHYDGRLWTELGFHFGPELISTVLAVGGSLTVSSTYLYKVWYEWTDAQGEIHRGPTSVGTSVTTGASDTQVTLTLPTLRVTRKENVRICVARSLPGDTSRLWRVTSLDPSTAGSANGYVANSTTTDSVSFVDQMSDADLQLQEPMYTTGGILSNDAAALGSHVVAGKNRLFFTDAQNGTVVRYSQRLAAGFGVEVAPELKHDVDPYGGAVTALAVMDDVVYVFKASAIFAFNGDGPLETGSTTSAGPTITGFSATQLITSDVGCEDPASIVLTPNGLMFKSAKGIMLLDRSRQVRYVGAPVEAYNSQSVRRATVLPDRTAALFLTDSGSSLYYDYLFDQWSTFTNHEGLDAAVVDGTYYYLRNNDIVFQETPGEHSDAGARIRLRFETAWLHIFDHLQGFQRFWKLILLGTWSSPHQLAVSHRTDYAEGWTDPYYLDATGEDTGATGWITGDNANVIGEDPILGSDYGDGVYGDGEYGGTNPDIYQWRYGIHENGQAVQFRFEDYEKAGLAGASFELTEMTITGGAKKVAIRPFSGARST